MRYEKTEWGIRVKVFSMRYGITLKEIAAAADVKYPTFLQVLVGKTPGHTITEKVDAFMEEYTAKKEADQTTNKKWNSFEEATGS